MFYKGIYINKAFLSFPKLFLDQSKIYKLSISEFFKVKMKSLKPWDMLDFFQSQMTENMNTVCVK